MTAAPTFLSIPVFVVGIPVAFVKARLAAVMPTARLREKLSPGILVFVITIIYLTVQHIQFFYDTIRCLTLLYNINLEKVNTQMYFLNSKEKITDSFHIPDIFRNFAG